MVWVPDLKSFEDLDPDNTGKVLAVGWLEPDHPYHKGTVSREFVTRLADLLVDPWQLRAQSWYHPCYLCRWTGGPSVIRWRGRTITLGLNKLWVPGEDCVYVAPVTIFHYVDAHHYRPPKQFQDAVMACPPMRSVNYFKHLLRNGPNSLRRRQRAKAS